MIRHKQKRSRKQIAAVGIAGLAAIIAITMVSMGFLRSLMGSMPNPVLFQGEIIMLDAALISGITVGAARWMYTNS